jgi:tRNA-specific 2-thiouridylase
VSIGEEDFLYGTDTMKGRLLKLNDDRGRDGVGRRVLLAMSGGVDSGVSALRLVEAGFDVVGLTMKNYCYGDTAPSGAPDRSCCSLQAIDDARGVCDRLGIRHMVADTEERFGREVYDNFLNEYRVGRTPNPCVRCNSIVRFDTLLDYAGRLGADRVATGHYARVFRSDSGRLYLARATSREKDQSYFLSGLGGEVLSRVLFPLGDEEKPLVRAAARGAGLEVAEKPESQDVCFIPDQSLPEFLDGKVEMSAGDIENTSGEVVGKHRGLAAYTVGQRKGLGVALGRPQYVVRLDVERNVVVVGDDDELASRSLACRLDWIDEDAVADAESLRVQIRSRRSARLTEAVEVDGTTARVTFAEPERAIAPGQTAAFYDGDVVVGSGVIERPEAAS